VIRLFSNIFDSGAELSAAIGLRQDFDAVTLRRLATTVKDADQVRRLLAVAAVYDGMSREEAARIGSMDRQTLRDKHLRRYDPSKPPTRFPEDPLKNLEPAAAIDQALAFRRGFF
jgi:hypothetical protein